MVLISFIYTSIVLEFDTSVICNDLGIAIHNLLALRAHEVVVTARFDEEHELDSVPEENLVLDFGFLDGELQHEEVLLVEMMLPWVGKDREHIKLPRLVEFNDLEAFVERQDFFVEFKLLQLPLLNVPHNKLPSVPHLQVLFTLHLVFDKR